MPQKMSYAILLKCSRTWGKNRLINPSPLPFLSLIRTVSMVACGVISVSSRTTLFSKSDFKDDRTYHFPLMVITAQLLPWSSVSFFTSVEKAMALIMPSPNFSFITAL